VTLTAGAGSAIITPPVGTMMDGYTARAEPSQGVHDDLYARAIVIDDGDTSIALVSCDLLGVDRRLVAEARDRAARAVDIPAKNIMIAATHTHGGPAGLRLQGLDEALLDVTARHIAGAIASAYRAKRPAVLKIGAATVDSVAMNRRHPDWPVDTNIFVLLLDDPDPLKPPVAAAINFSCHATVLYSTNLLLSADYPGYASRTVERVFPGLDAAFFNGACGNVNPAWIKQDHAEAERVGKVVGSAAARLIAELRPLGPGQRAHNIRWDEHPELPVRAGVLIDDVKLRVARRNVDLPIKTFLSADEYEGTVSELESRAKILDDSHRDERRRVMEQLTKLRTELMVAQAMRAQSGFELHPEIMAIGFGDGLALLALPGEFFVETIAAIREQAGLRYLPVACYANHYIGYVVPPPAYDEGGYEPGVTLLAPEAEAIVVREAVGLLGEVAG
jgi:hypothetical protein